ncbi:MAG: hypothetical protein ABFC57_15505, partial [Veillonellales bacterium]
GRSGFWHPESLPALWRQTTTIFSCRPHRQSCLGMFCAPAQNTKSMRGYHFDVHYFVDRNILFLPAQYQKTLWCHHQHGHRHGDHYESSCAGGDEKSINTARES